MKHIRKGKEPASLTEHRAQPFAIYENYEQKNDLRDALLREQGFLCCYCMRRISNIADEMKIEHWAPQSENGPLQLTYTNLLAACKGGHGGPPRNQHCDTHKGNHAITINPVDTVRNCEHLVFYLGNGEITSSDPIIEIDVCRTLNLNLEQITKNRKAVLDAAIKSMRVKYTGEWTRSVLQKEIQKWSSTDGEGMYREYCQVVIYYLKKKSARSRST